MFGKTLGGMPLSKHLQGFKLDIKSHNLGKNLQVQTLKQV